ncbi:MAG: sugar phosphate isomerase/epimerase [Oscillospiraceae bacterium]|nr:sugar phosphate isomerase/epimerase [Oscillospiraceae bacterium]
MKIGCQTITFGNEMHKTDWRGVIKAVAQAGYEGMEVGFFRLDINEAENYKAFQAENGIAQAAIHIGGDFNDAKSVQMQFENLPNLMKLAHILCCEHIFLSGSPANAQTDYKLVCENINKLGKTLSEDGLFLSYHNHDWEAKNNCFGLYSLCDNTDPEYLSFVVDVGWVTQGGADPAAVLARLGNRVSSLHFKEFTPEGKFTELGCGIVDFAGTLKAAKAINQRKNFWIIAEQDASEIGAAESVAQNYAYIKKILS